MWWVSAKNIKKLNGQTRLEAGINKDGGKLKWILINMEVGIYL